MSKPLHHIRRAVARGLIVPIALGLALPPPALALRPEPDRGGLEEVLGHSTAGVEEQSNTHLELLRGARGLRVETTRDGTVYGISPDKSVVVSIHGPQLLISVGRTTDAMMFIKEHVARDSRTLEVSILDQYKTRVRMEGDLHPFPFTAHIPDVTTPLILDLDFDGSTPRTPRFTLTMDPRMKNSPPEVAFVVPLDADTSAGPSSAVLVVLRKAKDISASPIKLLPAAGVEEPKPPRQPEVLVWTLSDLAKAPTISWSELRMAQAQGMTLMVLIHSAPNIIPFPGSVTRIAADTSLSNLMMDVAPEEIFVPIDPEMADTDLWVSAAAMNLSVVLRDVADKPPVPPPAAFPFVTVLLDSRSPSQVNIGALRTVLRNATALSGRMIDLSKPSIGHVEIDGLPYDIYA